MPTISDVRRICKRDGLERAVLVFVTGAGEIGYASYGVDRAICADTRKLADVLYDEACRTSGKIWGNRDGC